MTISLNPGRPTPLRRAGILAATLALLIVAAGPLRAEDDPVVAKVNGADIHQSDLAVAEEEAGQLPPMGPRASWTPCFLDRLRIPARMRSSAVL